MIYFLPKQNQFALRDRETRVCTEAIQRNSIAMWLNVIRM